MDEDRLKQLEQEKAELNTLIGKGVSFDVDVWETTVTRHFFGLIRKKKQEKVKKLFLIQEPTLGTLDRLSAEWVELAIDEAMLKSDEAMLRARALAKHAGRLAKIVAIAVIGSEYVLPKIGKDGFVKNTEDTVRLHNLTNLFFHSIRPSELYKITVLINAMCNFGDFLNSIRLMQTDRSAMPSRIEEERMG